MLTDTIKDLETKEVSSKSLSTIVYSYTLNDKKEIQKQELLLDLVEFINSNGQNKNYQSIIKMLYCILQKSNFIVKLSIKNKNQLELSTPSSLYYNYLFVLKNNTIYQLNSNSLETLLKDYENFSYLSYHLNLNQELPIQITLLSNNCQTISGNNVCALNYSKNIKMIAGNTLNENNNDNTSLNKFSYPFSSLNVKRNDSLRHRNLSIKKSRKTLEKKLLLKKKESLHNISNSDVYIVRKRNNIRGKSLRMSFYKNENEKEMSSKKHRFRGSFEKLNNEIVSKYYLCKREKDHFKLLINRSYVYMDKYANSCGLSEKEMLKKFFKGKYFKNIYQKVNVIQTNLRDYVNYENHDMKSEQGSLYSKFLNISLKNSKMANTESVNLDEKIINHNNNNNNINDEVNNTNTNNNNNNNNLNETTFNLSNSNMSVETDNLSSKTIDIEKSNTNINTNNNTNNENNNNNNNNNNNEENKLINNFENAININNNNNSSSNIPQLINKNKNNFESSNESVIILPSSEVITSSTISQDNTLLVEKENSISSANVKKNRRSKHNRSSAVCLSSNDIKGILSKTKKGDELLTSNNKSTSYILDGSLNDSIRNQKNYCNNTPLSKESLERRKLLSRNSYHPSLTTINSTQFCYNNYYPTVSLPLISRNSQIYLQPQPINRRLNA